MLQNLALILKYTIQLSKCRKTTFEKTLIFFQQKVNTQYSSQH
jgi:hypothetical protein